MNGFLNTKDTIAQTGLDGFKAFGPEHLIWLAILVATTVVLAVIYRRGCSCGCGATCPRAGMGSHRRQPGQKLCRHGMRMGIVMFLIADEILKYVLVAINHAPVKFYAPFQLCTICIVLCMIHGFTRPGTKEKPGSKLNFYLGNFLYLVGIAAGLSAILFPSWGKLPAFNLMSIHSFTAHIVLVAYIIMILAAGEIRISWKTVPVSVIALLAMAGIIYKFDIATGTNFMFLTHLSPGSPLGVFEALGDYRMGYAVILAVLIIVLYGGAGIIGRIKKIDKQEANHE